MVQWHRVFTQLRGLLAVLATALVACGLLAASPVTAAGAATTPRTGNLTHVSCLGPSFCLAVGNFGQKASPLAEEWNGSAWKVVRSPSVGVGTISCVSRTFCMALGPSASLRWNGSRWHKFSSAALTGMAGLDCASQTFCMAVGSNRTGDENLSASWNGTTWRSLHTPDTGCVPNCGLVRVDCPSAKACMAVGSTMNNAGDQGTAAAITWNGRRWHVHNAPSPDIDPGLSAVSCVSGLKCTAVGGYTTDQPACQCTLIAQWNGSTWQQVTNPTFTGTPSAVSCWQPTGCVAVDGSLALIEQAGIWKQQTVAAPGGAAAALNDVSCWHASACMAVGHYVTSTGAQLTLAERWNGSTWTVTHTWTPESPPA